MASSIPLLSAVVTSQKLGNGVTLSKAYRQDTGEAKSIYAANRISTNYGYDRSGNMATRTVRFGYGSNVRQYQQRFSYDTLNRLTTATDTATNQQLYSYQYDNYGNITASTQGQSDPGCAYDPNHPYKLLRHKGETLNYDASGNIKNYNGYQFSYTSFDKVKRISNPRNANDWTEYSYGTDGERFKKVENRIYQGKVERLTTEFIHAFYERHSRHGGAGDLLEEKYFIGDMVLTQRSNNTKDSFYTIKDQQGSVLMTLNGSGQEVNRYYYRPFGEQLDVSLNPLGLQTLRPTQYGYTGHEHVKDLDIINMGGRIYAAGLRRFLQADPVVGHPMYSQSYNPYQYVYGNPLVNVDPSGYMVIPQNFGPVFATGSIFIGFGTLAQLGVENPWSMRGLIHEQALQLSKVTLEIALAQDYSSLEDTVGSTTETNVADNISSDTETTQSGQLSSDTELTSAQEALSSNTANDKQENIGTADTATYGTDIGQNITQYNSVNNGEGKRKYMKAVDSEDAVARHTVMKINNKGEITNYQTFELNDNPRNPNKWVKGKRTDLVEASEFNKVTKEWVATPHTHDDSVDGGIRPAHDEEIPNKKNSEN